MLCTTYLLTFILALLISNPNIKMYQEFNELLIINDECCYNIVCALELKKVFRATNINVIGFTNSKEGLAYITRTFNGTPNKTVLFLDINMPHMNGWEVLAQLEQLPRAVRKNLDVYIVTTSPNERDEYRALRSSLVKQYLPKPLSNHLQSIFAQRTLQLTAA